MSDDALGMFNAMRPQMPAQTNDVRDARGGLRELAMVPGSPSYRARIPRPPCYLCGDDHAPNQMFDHDWQPEPAQVHDEPVSATAVRRQPQVIETLTSPHVPETAQRVALYVGRSDTYVIAVEAAPDWDAVHTFKVESDMVLPLINLVRALGVKVSDKTGGDLLMLEQEYAGRQSSKTDGRSASPAGTGSPRQPEPGPSRAEEDQPSPSQGTPG